MSHNINPTSLFPIFTISSYFWIYKTEKKCNFAEFSRMTPQNPFIKYVYIEITKFFWKIHSINGQNIFSSWTYANVLKTIHKRNVFFRCWLDRNCLADFIFHRRSRLYTNQIEYPKCLDAQLGAWIYHSRNHVVGV